MSGMHVFIFSFNLCVIWAQPPIIDFTQEVSDKDMPYPADPDLSPIFTVPKHRPISKFTKSIQMNVTWLLKKILP